MNFSGISNTTLLGRILRGPLQLIPAGAVVPILQGPMRGRKWVVGSGTHGCWMGRFEHDKQRVFAHTVAAGDVVYDLGVNIGFYSLVASVLATHGAEVHRSCVQFLSQRGYRWESLTREPLESTEELMARRS